MIVAVPAPALDAPPPVNRIHLVDVHGVPASRPYARELRLSRDLEGRRVLGHAALVDANASNEVEHPSGRPR